MLETFINQLYKKKKWATAKKVTINPNIFKLIFSPFSLDLLIAIDGSLKSKHAFLVIIVFYF